LSSLILTIDANFRLKLKDKGLPSNDHSLGDGWGYWVPEKGYIDYIKEYGHQHEVGGKLHCAVAMLTRT
jgi:hypothetical protein